MIVGPIVVDLVVAIVDLVVDFVGFVAIVVDLVDLVDVNQLVVVQLLDYLGQVLTIFDYQ